VNGFWSKGIASLGPIDDNAGDSFGGVLAELGAGLAGKSWLPVDSGVDDPGGLPREQWQGAV
jgi:hypothetical protein